MFVLLFILSIPSLNLFNSDNFIDKHHLYFIFRIIKLLLNKKEK